MFGFPVTWIAIGVLSIGLAGSGWMILHQAEAKGQLEQQLAGATAAAAANAEIAQWERADRERAQRIAARNAAEKNRLEADAAKAREATYNVRPEENGPVAPVLRRALDRLRPAAGAAAAGEAAAADDRPGAADGHAGAVAPRP